MTNPTQLDSALEAIAANAKNLLVDAEILFSRDRFARAMSLGVLAIEEVGKFYQTKLFGSSKDDKARNHVQKQSLAAILEVSDNVSQEIETFLRRRGLRYEKYSNEDDKKSEENDPISQDLWKKVIDEGILRQKIADIITNSYQKGLPKLVRDGGLSPLKNLGFYVDMASDLEVKADPKSVTREQAFTILNLAQAAIDGIKKS